MIYHAKSYLMPFGVKPLYINFDEIDGYINDYDGGKYIGLVFFDEKHERIFDKINYLFS